MPLAMPILSIEFTQAQEVALGQRAVAQRLHGQRRAAHDDGSKTP